MSFNRPGFLTDRLRERAVNRTTHRLTQKATLAIHPLAAPRQRQCPSLRLSGASPLAYDKTLYRQRHRIENAFGRLKDWRRVATRYDRCAPTFFSAICIAATVTFWL